METDSISGTPGVSANATARPSGTRKSSYIGAFKVAKTGAFQILQVLVSQATELSSQNVPSVKINMQGAESVGQNYAEQIKDFPEQPSLLGYTLTEQIKAMSVGIKQRRWQLGQWGVYHKLTSKHCRQKFFCNRGWQLLLWQSQTRFLHGIFHMLHCNDRWPKAFCVCLANLWSDRSTQHLSESKG